MKDLITLNATGEQLMQSGEVSCRCDVLFPDKSTSLIAPGE